MKKLRQGRSEKILPRLIVPGLFLVLLFSPILFSPFAHPGKGKDARSKEVIREVRAQIEETQRAYRACLAELERRKDELKLAQAADTNAPGPQPEKGLEEIFREISPPAKEKKGKEKEERREEAPPAAEVETEKIEKGAGEYTGFKFPWFASLLNPSIGLMVDTVGLFGTQKNAYEDMNKIEMREAELNLYAGVDPFARGFALISGKDEVKVEEAYAVTSALPFNLEVRGGKFFSNFGRLNKIHTHDLPFLDQPLTMQNFLGAPESEEDDQRVSLTYEPQFKATGAELLWIAPTPFYWRLIGGVYNSFTDRSPGSFWDQYLGHPDFQVEDRGPSDFTYMLGSRFFFELSPDHSLRFDLYGMYDSPTDQTQRTLESLAITYRWYPLEYGLYRGLEWTTEVFFNQERFLKDVTGLDEQKSWGLYSYLEYKLSRTLSPGIIGEWGSFRFDDRAKAWHGGGWISYYPSERQRIRFCVDYYDEQEWLNSTSRAMGIPAGDGDFWQFAIQWTIVIGSHMHTYD
jgi:hypothetical protein